MNEKGTTRIIEGGLPPKKKKSVLRTLAISIFAFIAIAVIVHIGSKDKEKETAPPSQNAPVVSNDTIISIPLTQLKKFVRGSSWIKNFAYDSTNRLLTIDYYPSYDAYKQANPDSRLEQSNFDSWFGTQELSLRLYIVTPREISLYAAFFTHKCLLFCRFM